jgi:branched-chain amino acid transport system ATP-binding protein
VNAVLDVPSLSSAAPHAQQALEVRGLTRDFGGLRALDDVNLSVARGERFVVIGPNGAGKSTLFRVIAGEHAPSGGEVRVLGTLASGWPPERIAALGVSRSFQTSSLFQEQSALENAMLAANAHDPARRGFWKAFSNHEALRDKAMQALEHMGLGAKALTVASSLSHGEKRQLELAMALVQRPQVLLLDEPLAGLSALERERVSKLLMALPRDLTVLLVEHDLAFALAFADQLMCLHNGRVLALGEPEAIKNDPEVQRVYIGQALGRPPGEAAEAALSMSRAEIALEVRGLAAQYGSASVLEGINLELRRGEVVTVLGRNGAGKTTLMHSLMGLHRQQSGAAVLFGSSLARAGALARAHQGLALVPQGRRVLRELTVREELGIATRGRGLHWTVSRVLEVFPRLRERLTFDSTKLSGGEQQMLAIARALLRNPRVILMDEPSEGLSPLMVRVVQDVIQTLKANGETLLLTEQNLDLALAVADRVYVLEHGQIVFEGTVPALLARQDLVTQVLGVS